MIIELPKSVNTMRLAFPVDLQVSQDGPPVDHCVLVTFPDLPEANTFGTDLKDALVSAIDCLEVALLGRIIDRSIIPEPSPALDRLIVTPRPHIELVVIAYLANRCP